MDAISFGYGWLDNAGSLKTLAALAAPGILMPVILPSTK